MSLYGKLYRAYSVLKGWFETLVEKLVNSFWDLKVVGITSIIEKTDVGKYAVLSHFPILKTPNSDSRFGSVITSPCVESGGP